MIKIQIQIHRQNPLKKIKTLMTKTLKITKMKTQKEAKIRTRRTKIQTPMTKIQTPMIKIQTSIPKIRINKTKIQSPQIIFPRINSVKLSSKTYKNNNKSLNAFKTFTSTQFPTT